MAQTEPWFRFWTETPSDPKLKRAAIMAGCKKNASLATWTAILTLAKRSPIPGTLLIAKNVPAADYDIDETAGNEDIDLTNKLIAAFIALDMLGCSNGVYVVIHWNERQFSSDNSTERWKRWKGKKSSNVGPTLEDGSRQRLSNGPESDTESDTDKEYDDDDKDRKCSIIYSLYQTEIGPLTPLISDALKDAETTYPIEWFAPAFKEAAGHNARNWKYIETILKNWQINGFKSKPSPPSQAQNPPPRPPAANNRRAVLERMMKEGEPNGTTQ